MQGQMMSRQGVEMMPVAIEEGWLTDELFVCMFCFALAATVSSAFVICAGLLHPSSVQWGYSEMDNNSKRKSPAGPNANGKPARLYRALSWVGLKSPKKNQSALIARWHAACRYGDLTTVCEILGASPESVAQPSVTHDIAALAFKNAGVPIIDVNALDIHGRTGLWWACRGGKTDVVFALATHSAVDVQKQDPQRHRTPLFVACESGHLAIVELLLQHPNVEPSLAADFGVTPLHIACAEGHLNVAKALVGTGKIDINATDSEVARNDERDNAIECSSPIGMLRKIANRAKVARHSSSRSRTASSPKRSTCRGGRTPLWFAAASGCIEVVHYLLSVPGIDVNLCAQPLETSLPNSGSLPFPKPNLTPPLGAAAAFGHFRLVEVMSCCRRVNCRGGALPPFHAACCSGEVGSIRALMWRDRVDVNQPDCAGRTGFWLACSAGQIEAVEYLASMPEIDLHRPDASGTTPFHIACANGRVGVVEFLLHNGFADMGICSNTGKTPLMTALTAGHGFIVRRLLAWRWRAWWGQQPNACTTRPSISNQSSPGANSRSSSSCGSSTTLPVPMPMVLRGALASAAASAPVANERMNNRLEITLQSPTEVCIDLDVKPSPVKTPGGGAALPRPRQQGNQRRNNAMAVRSLQRRSTHGVQMCSPTVLPQQHA